MKIIIRFWALALGLLLCESGFAQPKLLQGKINSPGGGYYAPTISSDGKTLIYEANLRTGWKVFETHLLPDSTWDEPIYIEEINNTGNEDDFIGGPILTYDGNYIFYTSDRQDGFGYTDLWFSKRMGDKWSIPVNLGEPVNTSGYEGFPSLSSDGSTLYFMRIAEPDTKDSVSCFVIYSSKLMPDGKWSTPVALPAPINTGCESYPRIMADGKTLLFSSYREGGLGKTDIYKSVMQNDSTWSTPVPFSFLNTPLEDAMVTVPASGDVLYYTAGKKDDTYLYSLVIPKELRQEISVVVKGVVKDKETNNPMGALVEFKDIETNKLMGSANSNEVDGKYMVVLPKGKIYDFSVSLKGYTFYSSRFDLTMADKYVEMENDISLETLKENTTFTLNNIVFDSNSAKLKPELLPELDRMVNIMKINPDIKVEISAHTDDIGTDAANLALSQNRASSVVKYLTDNGVTPQRLIAKGYGETHPRVPNKNDVNRSLNRRVEFKIIK